MLSNPKGASRHFYNPHCLVFLLQIQQDHAIRFYLPSQRFLKYFCNFCSPCFLCKCLICWLTVLLEQIVWLFVRRVFCRTSIYKTHRQTQGQQYIYPVDHILGETCTIDHNQTIKGDYCRMKQQVA